MKKISLPIFLLGIILLPGLIIYIADKDGAITNPEVNESEFIDFITPEVFKALSAKEKSTLLEHSGEDAIDLLNTRQDYLSGKFHDGSFLCVFYNDINQDDDWYEFSFGMLSKGEYFSIKIKTGLYEKISLEQYTNHNDKVLFEHYIPLEQNEYNTLQINITDGHILVMLNNKIIFHLLLKNQSFSGGINYASHFVDFEHPVKTKYIPIPETLKNSMYTVLKKIPPIIIE